MIEEEGEEESREEARSMPSDRHYRKSCVRLKLRTATE